jgi:hypothetical protein
MAYVIVHVCGAEEEDAGVVTELDVVYLGAVQQIVGAVVNVVLLVNQSNSRDPVPGLVRPVRVGLVVGVSSKASTKIEKAAVRDGVLVVIAVIERLICC